MRGREALQALAIALPLVLTSSLGHASALSVRDQNPLVAGFELPSALPATLPNADEWMLDVVFAWGSSAIVQTNSRETLIVDAETRELRFALGRTFSNGLAMQIDLPMRHTSAGSLDSFIDRWHGFFGLPEGVRPTLPRDALRIAYEHDGRWLFDERESQSGIGDVSLRLGKQLDASPITAWLALKAPTGKADRFTGSGSWDASVALALEHAFAGRYSVFAQAGGTWMSAGDRMAASQKSIAWSGIVGVSARAFQNFTLTAQVDAHSAVFESNADFLSEAVALTLGGTYRLLEHWDVSFAVTEDVAVESGPDVVFLFEIKKTW